MDLDVYHAKLKDWLVVLAAGEVSAYAATSQAYFFVMRLDDRYLADKYPATLFEAYTIASEHGVEETATVGEGSGGTTQKCFVLCKDTRHPAVRGQQQQQQQQPDGGGGKKKKRAKRVKGVVQSGDEHLTCYNCCEAVGHVSVNCPLPRRRKTDKKKTGKGVSDKSVPEAVAGDSPPPTRESDGGRLKGPRSGTANPPSPQASTYMSRDRHGEDTSSNEEEAYARCTTTSVAATTWWLPKGPPPPLATPSPRRLVR